MQHPALDPVVVAQIQARIDDIIRENDVRILLAIESGSRAWGFWSKDSDYDVRFVYQRRRDRYLSIAVDRARDVIETPLVGVFDVNGWDLRKALGLMRKSNPVLIEWFDSPIVYRSEPEAAAKLRELGRRTFNPAAGHYHYARMAMTNFGKHLESEEVRLKKYFYALRPLLACRWIEEGLGPVPMLFRTLLDRFLPGGALRQVIDELLRVKMSGDEVDRIPQIPILRDYIATELARVQETQVAACPIAPLEDFDGLFRKMVEEFR